MKKLFTKLILFMASAMMGTNAWADEYVIYQTGFESEDNFVTSTSYYNEVEIGPEGKKWKTIGTVTANDKKNGSNGLQMRISKTMEVGTNSDPYAQTEFDISEISKIEFYHRTDDATCFKKVKLQYSLDSGDTWKDAEEFTPATSWESTAKSVSIPEKSTTMRIRFYVSDWVPNSNGTKKFTIDDVKIYTSPSNVVPVTGLSIDKTSLTINEGSRETLISMISPNDATNKSVTWTSNNEAVATVADGVVTGVSVGTATITATTDNGGYTASCTVTVTPLVGTVYSWNGTGSTTEAAQVGGTASVPIESSNNMLAGSLQKGNWCFKIGKGVSSNGGPYVILITLEKALKTGDVITGAVFRAATSDASFGLDFLAADASATSVCTIANPQILSSDGTPEDNISYVVPESADGTKVIRLYRNSGSTTIYVSKFEVTRPVDNITVSAAEYITYYNSDNAYTMPEGLTGYTFFENSLEKAYNEGDVVPAGEPLVLSGSAGNYTLFKGETTSASWKEDGMNNLCGAATDMTATEMATANPGSNYFYALSLNSAGEANSIGFYWRNNGGAAFDITAGKAYLVLPQSSAPVRGFAFNGGEATAIKTVNTTANNTVRYNLAGQRVNANAKGIVIVNGKKIFK